MAGDGSVDRSDGEDNVSQSYRMVDLEHGTSSKIDSRDAGDRNSDSESYSIGSIPRNETHVPVDYDESDNLLPTEETSPRVTIPETPADLIPLALDAIAKWAKGPQPPRPYKIVPYFPRIQTSPIRFLEKRLSTRSSKFWTFLIFVSFWIIVFASILYISVVSADIPGHGPPITLSCVTKLW